MAQRAQATRRDFFHGAAAAALAAPVLVRSSAFGANDRIAAGIIGLGGPAGGGGGGAQTIAVCDVREDKLAGHRDNKSLSVYTDFRELLARDDVDCVYIGTPDHWHALPAIEAAKAGKDIYCEKPMTLTIREGRAMVNAVRQYGRVFQTGSQQRSDYGGCFRFACEMVRSGRIGQLKEINCNVGGPSADCYLPEEPVPPGVDWDRWLGPAPWRPFNRGILHGWRSFRDYSGGGMTDWGAHHFDIAQWALDADNSGPTEIYPPGTLSERLTYVYANGVKVYHGGGGGGGVVFFGTEGKIAVDRGPLQSWPESIMKKPLAPDEVHLYTVRNGHAGNFVECIRTRRRPICDVEIGCRSVTVCHLGNLAYRLGRPLKWDPAKEEFVGDPEANRWLDRPKRAPWTL
ncbi:MAG: Gfo/Idh/MocA family oxidoreductase [Planctomycetes bacterium]|nr:Gfo/Idh/MocA family oxidoreductase [Planctomycetota bacterium]